MNDSPRERRPRPALQHLGPIEQLRAGRLPRRLLQLLVGLALYGFSLALVIHAALGAVSWDVLHLGLAERLPISVGTALVLTSFAVLLAWIPLKQWPGVGTFGNAVLVGIALDLTLPRLPDLDSLPLRAVVLVAGVFLNGLATAMYVGAQLGPGPRDGLMTGLARVTGRSIRLVRTLLEISVVVIGLLLGGPAGVGTVLYALTIGPVTQALLPWCTVRLPDRPPPEPDPIGH